MSPSTWQEAQEPVPLPDNLASYMKPRPLLIKAGVGSVPTGISLDTAFCAVLITEMEFEIRFRQYKVPEPALRASPRGPRLLAGSTLEPEPLACETSTKESTLPFVSTLATRSVPKAATYMK